MRIAIGSDHRGVEKRAALAQWLSRQGYEVDDCGAPAGVACDYPDIAADVAVRVSRHQADRGILMCGSGIGMSIAANKIPGVRAALVHDLHGAEFSRKHNDANVLCLSADQMDETQMAAIVELWLESAFEGGRHARRVEKIQQLESSFSRNLP